jgi:hypothetical protein
MVWQREHLWELRLKSVGDSVTGVAKGALVGVSVFFVMLHMVWQREHLWELRFGASVGDPVTGVAEEALVGVSVEGASVRSIGKVE